MIWYKRAVHYMAPSAGGGIVHYLLYKKTPPTLKTIRFESGAEERHAGQKTGLTTWKITPVLEGKLEQMIIRQK